MVVRLLCEQLKVLLDFLPREGGAEESAIPAGFVTCTKALHLYHAERALAQPQLMVGPDVGNMLDGFLVNVSESQAVITSLLDQIPEKSADMRETETVFAPIIQARMEALKAAECPRKLFLFHSSLPTAESPGRLKNGGNRKLIIADKTTLSQPQAGVYQILAKECVAHGYCADLGLFWGLCVTVAMLSAVPSSLVALCKHACFQGEHDQQRFLSDHSQDLQKVIGFNAVLWVQTSTHVRAVDFFVAFYMSDATDVGLGGDKDGDWGVYALCLAPRGEWGPAGCSALPQLCRAATALHPQPGARRGDSEQPCEDYLRRTHHSVCPYVGLLQKERCKLLLWTTADPSRGQEAAPSRAELCAEE